MHLPVPQLHLQDDLAMPAGVDSALDDWNGRQRDQGGTVEAADEDSFSPFESADAEMEARLEGLPSSLRSADPTSALEELAELIDAAEGEWASALGSYVRSAGIVADLVDLIDHDDQEVYALAMRVLANLCSDAVDPQSSATKEVVRKHNGFPRLLPHCFGEDPVALMYTLGAIQNLCTSIEYTKMVMPPLRERIREVAQFTTDVLGENIPEALTGLLVHYAEGILINITMCERELTSQQGASHGEAVQEARPDFLRQSQLRPSTAHRSPS
eukprot:scaffold82898_cov54-Phaeocystis_antarctica.AAC.1